LSDKVFAEDVLCQSMISNEVWEILDRGDKEEFKRRVRAHFALGMPDYELSK